MNDMSDYPTIELTPIPNRPGYLASRLGVIFSTRRKGSRYGTYPPTPLTENVNGNGYNRVIITVNGITKHEFVHKLILETFVGPCPAGMECRHGMAGKGVNRLSNIQWGTRVQNRRDRPCKLSPKDIPLIRSMTSREARERYGIARSTTNMIKRRKIWSDIE